MKKLTHKQFRELTVKAGSKDYNYSFSSYPKGSQPHMVSCSNFSHQNQLFMKFSFVYDGEKVSLFNKLDFLREKEITEGDIDDAIDFLQKIKSLMKELRDGQPRTTAPREREISQSLSKA